MSFGQNSQAGSLAVSHGGSPMPMKWYVVHTYSGHENKAKLSLLDRVRQAGLNDKFGDILIPTDTVVELVKGQKRSTRRRSTWSRTRPRSRGSSAAPTRSRSRRRRSRTSTSP